MARFDDHGELRPRKPHQPDSSARPAAARPAAGHGGLLQLQREAGNAAVTSLIQRQPATYLDQLARAGRPTPVPVPEGMPGTHAWAVTVPVDQAARLAALAGTALPETQVPQTQPELESVTIIYTNDGSGPFPNIGGGADHELTASVHVRMTFTNSGTGWTSGGYNLEIWTPQKGGPPAPLPGYAPGRYPGQPGPDSGGYKGLVFADFAYRVSGTGARELTVLTRMGANSTWLGEQIQSNLVHRPLEIALFDWQHEPTEPYGAVGLRGLTLLDLLGDESVSDARFRMRLTLSAHALAGTHDAEAGGAATLSVHSGFIRLGDAGRAAVELRFGADGRGLARYNDQGGERAGLEAGVSNEIRVHLRDVVIPDFTLFAGGRSQQSTLPEGRAPGEDGPSGTGAWLGPGSKAQGWIGLEIPLR